VKAFMDGALGAGTALMFAPFDDDPGNTGVAMPESEGMEERIAKADAAGMQVEVHAIGDKANAQILDIFDRVAKRKDRRTGASASSTRSTCAGRTSRASRSSA
jgi:predicted amidohydrolase YtcJ